MSATHDPPRDPADDEGALVTPEVLPVVTPPEDFLASVQGRIRHRSGGKFFRSRWSTSPGVIIVQIVSLAMLLVIVLIWLLASPVVDLGTDEPRPAAGDRSERNLRPPVKIQLRPPEFPGSPPAPPPR